MLIEGLYSVESFEKEGQNVTATVKLNAAHDVFKGHFPGNPVMPGVCMIQIIKELTEQATEKMLFLSVATNVKFMAIINPEKNDTIQLKLTITEEEAIVKVKNTTTFDDTLALKLSATFNILT
ncbi:3-hydroxyacyl-ACP dehydratase [Zobellia galactanivorans]|uniref:3-hydroxyacyl-ACP dehydratase n=1 Tax=Zobellia TaxID=112040 RepID=UPI000B536E28|nr:MULTISPECIES: 3-hydroxyacyl-ACP dehydratase [Zobellia]MBU3026426.1 3-hydroxyacyl-ACP dehydratase [Zobellia galactanivorans]MDO6810041.1 3-hydroxyacyl-ACP dehydratase [Zobellia galactanivorans]OWW27087.1 3-hydroxyacyl-ACP dehydratase [Zobellia sp. OII3]